MKEDTHSGSVRIVMLLCWILSLAVLMIEAVDGRLNSTKELDAVFLLLWLVLEAESILKLKKKIAKEGFRETFKFNGAEMLWVILAFISVIVMLASQSGWMRWVVLLRGPSVLRRFNDEKTFEVIGEMIVVVLILFFVVPFFNIIAVALSAPGQIINVIPQNIDFFALNYVIHDTAFLKSFLNSIFITVAGTLIGTIAMAMAAYPLSRPELPFRRGWMVFYMITMYFGGGMAPAIVLMNALGLMNTMGDKGGIRLTYGGEFTLYTTEHGALVKYVPEVKTRNMFETEINSFVRCIRTGEKLPSHIDTAVLTSRIMQAIYDSAATHREVVLES